MFNADVCNQIGRYVSRLLDPSNGETFTSVVGRGTGRSSTPVPNSPRRVTRTPCP